MNIILLFTLGFLYANTAEVFMHWFFLHKLGKKKNSIFSFHWKRHHRMCRVNNMLDSDYEKPFYAKERIFEVLSLVFLLIIHTPLAFVALPAYLAVVAYMTSYYFVHKYCHYNSENAKKWFKAHYWHHMGKNQDQNWGTIIPLVDYIIGSSYLNKKK